MWLKAGISRQNLVLTRYKALTLTKAMIKCQYFRESDGTTGVKQIGNVCINRNEFWGRKGAKCFGWELQKGSPVLHRPFRDFPSTTSFSAVKPYTDDIKTWSHWSTVVFTFLLFCLFCLGISTLCHQNHGDKVVGLVAFYFIRRKTVKRLQQSRPN